MKRLSLGPEYSSSSWALRIANRAYVQKMAGSLSSEAIQMVGNMGSLMEDTLRQSIDPAVRFQLYVKIRRSLEASGHGDRPQVEFFILGNN